VKRRREEQSDSFGLSFLDVICCGFGAVILLFIMTTRTTGEAVEQTVEDMSAEIERVLLQLEEEQTDLAEIEEKGRPLTDTPDGADTANGTEG